MPELLYDRVIEVEERVAVQRDDCLLNRKCEISSTSTGEQVCCILLVVSIYALNKIYNSTLV